MCVCVHMCVCVCVLVVYVCMGVYMCMYVCTYVYMHMNVCVCVHVKFLLTGTSIIGTIHLATTITLGLAASPSLPGRSQLHAQWGGSSKLFTDQSDHTEMICFKFSHNFGGRKQATCVSDQTSESIQKGRVELNLSYLDASQETEHIINSNC